MKRLRKLIVLMISALVVGGICTTGYINTIPVIASEKSIDYIIESNYSFNMKNIVEPYIDAYKKSGYVDVGETDFKIYYEKYTVDKPKGIIVLSHGFTESLEKFHEIIYYYIQEGYSVYGMEHRGHGRSGHLGKKDSTQVNVNNFNDYVSDFKKFMDKIVVPETQGKKLLLFAHSMGGAIGARFLETYPQYFNAAVLSAPMFEINTGNVPAWLASALANTSVALSFGDNYVAGQGAYNGKYNFKNAATGCEERYSYYHDIETANTEIQRGGASYRWLQKSIGGAKDAINKSNIQNVKIPVLLFQAENDAFVKAGGQNIFAENAANCTLVKVSGAKHEIYRECDSILQPYLKQVMDFYNNI